MSFLMIIYSCGIFAQSSEKLIETDDQVKLWSKSAGKGEICIFVHGGPGMWSRSFEDLGGNVLEDKLQMIYFDQRGSGRSELSKEGNYSIERMVEDIETIRKTYTNEKVYLMGHSFGGILITHYSIKYPAHLKGIILLNSTLNIQESLTSQIDYVNQLMGNPFKYDETNMMNVFNEARQLMSKNKWEYKFLTQNEANSKKLDSIDAMKPQQWDFASKVFNYPEYLQNHTLLTAEIKIPALVIAGNEDYAIGVNHYQSFKFPKQKVHIAKGGHIYYYENNKDFYQVVTQFIKDNN